MSEPRAPGILETHALTRRFCALVAVDCPLNFGADGTDVRPARIEPRHLGQLRDQFGTTTFLTTHTMDEADADALCDELAIPNRHAGAGPLGRKNQRFVASVAAR
jgi:hypothetical protein